ncbi:MAG: ribbon-helix-helix protein, CopG family, partial [Candidatus Margulisbacteria bacterium]|nr:ribbon-helix-helix protein, CopG family [Candidatus Margulisiibacteriota bacterium]
TANPRINITVPPEFAAILDNKARRERVSLSKIALRLIQSALERDEDIYYSKLAADMERKNKKWHTHKDAWR